LLLPKIWSILLRRSQRTSPRRLPRALVMSILAVRRIFVRISSPSSRICWMMKMATRPLSSLRTSGPSGQHYHYLWPMMAIVELFGAHLRWRTIGFTARSTSTASTDCRQVRTTRPSPRPRLSLPWRTLSRYLVNIVVSWRRDTATRMWMGTNGTGNGVARGQRRPENTTRCGPRGENAVRTNHIRVKHVTGVTRVGEMAGSGLRKASLRLGGGCWFDESETHSGARQHPQRGERVIYGLLMMHRRTQRTGKRDSMQGRARQ
jgi:hypothetical protein